MRIAILGVLFAVSVYGLVVLAQESHVDQLVVVDNSGLLKPNRGIYDEKFDFDTLDTSTVCSNLNWMVPASILYQNLKNSIEQGDKVGALFFVRTLIAESKLKTTLVKRENPSCLAPGH